MTLRDLLKKKGDMDRLRRPMSKYSEGDSIERSPSPPFRFVRTTTNEQEVIQPPGHPEDTMQSISWANLQTQQGSPGSPKDKTRKRHSLFRTSSMRSSRSLASTSSDDSNRSHRSLSKRLSSLHIRSPPPTTLPPDLLHPPQALPAPATPKAALPTNKSILASWTSYSIALTTHLSTQAASVPAYRAPESSDDATLQRAITTHEQGDLTLSASLLRPLPQPMARLLYALALRHGWGIPADPALAFALLLSAARSPPERALGLYELAQSLKHGWGVGADPWAARACYAAAANLGDVDAAGEVAGMMMRGDGGAKDRRGASGYLRRAQVMGRTGTAESWVWKAKYDPAT